MNKYLFLIFTIIGIFPFLVQAQFPIVDQNSASQYKYELRPIKWDIAISGGDIKSSYIPKITQSGDELFSTLDQKVNFTLSGAYYWKYNLIFETHLNYNLLAKPNVGWETHRSSFIRNFEASDNVVSYYSGFSIGENVKYKFPFQLYQFILAIIPYAGFEYQYVNGLKDYKQENWTSLSTEENTAYLNGTFPKIKGQGTVLSNNLFYVNAGVTVEFIYNNLVGLWGSFYYSHGFNRYYRTDITYQYNNKPEQTVNIDHRINGMGFNIGLKYYIRTK